MDPVSIAAVGRGISSAGWLISPIISKLVNKCLSCLGSHSADRLKKLESRVRQLKLMLEVAEASPSRDEIETLKQWTQKLKSAFYEAEDIQDDIDYDNLESRILSQTTGKSDVTVSQCKITKDIRTKLEATLKQIEKLVDEGHELLSRLNLAVSCDPIKDRAYNAGSKRSSIVNRSETNSFPPTDVFGRDKDLEMIRKMLRESPAHETSSSRTKCYSVIGIYGIPGSGKTTLAQYVSLHEKKDNYFNLFMWIYVSRDFSVRTVFAEMLEYLEIAGDEKMDPLINLDKLQMILEEELMGRRFLLVLDDVWYDNNNNNLIEQQKQLDQLLSPLMVGEMGSKILVTTRTKDAAKALGAQQLVQISEMDEEQFLSMFMHYALDPEINDQTSKTRYWSIGKEISTKLERSPLAARTVAGQLRIRQEEDFWLSTMKSDLLNNKTIGALWWSYQQLDEHVKQCFTFCSIFPRRYELQRDELVQMWMAEGFVKVTDATKDMEDVGHNYFHALLSVSFVQLKENDSGKSCYKIHDLLHELAERAAGSDCFRIEKGMVGQVPQDVRHIFIMSYDQRWFEEEILNLKSLRTVITLERMLNEDFCRLLQSLKKLRVVHVKLEPDRIYVPKGIKLKHLRYLGVFGIILVFLPRQFSKLYHLQKFVAESDVHYYFDDNEIANLVNLRYIKTLHGEFLYPDIGRLTSLRTLSVFRVSKIRGYEIQQLEHLDNLHAP